MHNIQHTTFTFTAPNGGSGAGAPLQVELQRMLGGAAREGTVRYGHSLAAVVQEIEYIVCITFSTPHLHLQHQLQYLFLLLIVVWLCGTTCSEERMESLIIITIVTPTTTVTKKAIFSIY
jgi:hypothetical protein